jgi:oligoribonuclease NrnB/cAMP/cGMP phosphodiesterase (DHH superfamily)
MKMRPLCIYHAHCADGAAAAWVVHRALGPEIDFRPMSYGETPPDVTGRDVIMVDFSFKRPTLEAMARQADSILILDHHLTAQAELGGIDTPRASGVDHVYQDAESGSVAAIFDMDRAGCQIAWDQFFPAEPRPQLVDYIADRDLWRFALPGSREINAAIASHGFALGTMEDLAATMAHEVGRNLLASEGRAILRAHDRNIGAVIDQTLRLMVIGDTPVRVVNCPGHMASDAAGRLAEGNPFAAAYFDTADRTRKFSLRSRGPDGADVAAIAAQYGGGGHRNAAGFEMPLGWEGDE